MSFSLVGCKTASAGETTEAETTAAVTTAAAETTAAPEKVKIVFQNWTGAEDATKQIVADLLNAFMEKFPNIEVESLALPWSQHFTQLVTSTAAGDPPDVMQSIGAYPFELGGMAGLMDLKKFDDPAYWNDVPENLLGFGKTTEGVQVAVPEAIIPMGLWGNKKLMAEAGITEFPKTIDELKGRHVPLFCALPPGAGAPAFTLTASCAKSKTRD